MEETRSPWDEAAGQSALTRTDSAWERAIIADPVGDNAAEVNLVGVLKGDVNGSWAAPEGSIALEPVYFQELTALIGVSENYWG